MTLLELIKILRNRKSADQFVSVEFPGIESGQIDIYLKNSLHPDAQVKLVDAETIPNLLRIKIDNQDYINLFPGWMAQDMVEELAKLHPIPSDMEIVTRLLDYRERDA